MQNYALRKGLKMYASGRLIKSFPIAPVIHCAVADEGKFLNEITALAEAELARRKQPPQASFRLRNQLKRL